MLLILLIYIDAIWIINYGISCILDRLKGIGFVMQSCSPFLFYYVWNLLTKAPFS